MGNQGTNEDDSQSDPHPEVGPAVCQSRQSIDSDTDEADDMVTGVGSPNDPCPEAMISCHHSGNLNSSEVEEHPGMVTRVQKEITYCSVGTSSGKQRKARSTSQPPFCSESTPATVEADQILLALQQLASNSNSANINKNKTSKLPKSLTTTMPTFDGKSEKFELFEYPFQTSLKIHNQLTEEDKINYFHFLTRGDAPQTFKNIGSRNRGNLREILTVFCRK